MSKGPILIACEESQAVCKAFRKKGFEAYSCDILECSGDHPEWHIQGDAISEAYSGKYDLMIAHPPCTYLTNAGVTHLWENRAAGIKNLDRWVLLAEGSEFFSLLLNAPIKHIAVENPIMHKYAKELIGCGQQDQLVQPYHFGHMERKATCFWLKNLPPLEHTNNVYAEMVKLPKREQQRLHYLPPSKDRAKLRSKTYQGIANAMAEQWGNFLLRGEES